jgi:hypothetical protein
MTIVIHKKKMLVISSILVALGLLCAGITGLSQTNLVSLSSLNFEQSILLFGDRGQFDFYIPVGFPAEGVQSTMTLFYRVTPLAGPRANVSLLVNDIPVNTQLLLGKAQPVVFSFPSSWIKERSLAKFSLLVDLDQEGCRVGESISAPDIRTLFFSIEQDTFFEIAYGEPSEGSLWSEPSVLRFFDPYGTVQDFHFVVDPTQLVQLQSMANIAYGLGLGSRGFSRTLTLSEGVSPTAKNIGFQEGNRIESGISSITLGTDLTPDLLRHQVLSALPLNQATLLSADFNRIPISDQERRTIPFSDLMDIESGFSIRFSGSQKSYIPLSEIGGIPINARLVLKIHSTPLEHPESIVGNIRLNGHLLKSISFHSVSQDVEISIPIPEQLFQGINEFEIQWINQTLCREVAIGFDLNSRLEFDFLRPLIHGKMSDLAHIFSGPKILVVTQPSLEAARILMEYAFFLGRNGTADRLFFVIGPQEMKANQDMLQSYDGLVLIMDPTELSFFEPLVDTSRSFKVVDRSRGTTLLEFDSRDPMGVIGAYSFMQKPVVMFTWYGSAAGFSWIQSHRFDQMIREGGNLLFLGARGMASVAIDKETNWVAVSLENKPGFWETWRIWIIVILGLVGILIIIAVYYRSSGKKRKKGG